MNSNNPNSQSDAQATWKRLFTGDLMIYSIILNLGILLFAVDTFVITTIMPTVIVDIGGTQLYAWPVMIFMVGAIVGAAATGPVRANFGRRNGYVFAGVLFLIGNLGAAYAPNIEMLIAWRLLQGLGGGLIISQSYGLIGDFYPPELRTRILSIVSTTWGVATVFGPAFGGIFAEFGSWRGAFWAIVPLAIIFCGLVWRHVAHSPVDKSGGMVVNFPITRLLLFALGILCVGLTSQTDNNVYRVSLIVAAIAMVAYAMIRDAKSSNRMFPKNTLILNTTVGSSYWFLLMFTFTFIVAILYATLYLQILHHQTPIAAAYISAVLSFTWTIGALLTASWKGPAVKLAVLGGGVLIVLGAIGLTLFAVKGPLVLIILSLSSMGFGIGTSNNHVIALTIECAEKGEEGLVASSVQTMRTMGLAFGSAMAGLLANIAGLSEGTGPETVARAVDLLNRWDIGLAALTLLSLLVFYYNYNRDKRLG
ncbi:MAG: MFS transporter [Rhodospirillaceae bacterium]|jgi:MFS family permease|nr:MFS transporter [Rhodospirillaceae bacterium]MBT4589188.1 MFS transporter [Rhodospirillaceae bacterium]MBT5941751.1 MFS transporter [Rhodospirillaceae bacterium]MBT7267661.1 MFS transporter [Rhodospirillaceae bacterium]